MSTLVYPHDDGSLSTPVNRSKSSRKARARPESNAGPSTGPGELTPPSSGSQYERDAPQMLMSPPPEELLRSARAKSTESRLSTSPQKHQTPRRVARSVQASTATKRKRVHALAPEQPSSPPGDELTFASSSRLTIDVTPNPKARKQSRTNTTLVSAGSGSTKPTRAPTKSPKVQPFLHSRHISNPRADYLPPFQEQSREHISWHRSVTPTARYEPPADRFTPPREVVYTPLPSVSKSSKRKSTPWSRSAAKTKGKERRLTLQIKIEPPEVDLNAPLPPASPSDDPLLLYGRPRSLPRKKALKAGSTSTHSRYTPPISSSSPALGPLNDATQLLDVTMTALDHDLDSSDALETAHSDRLPLGPFDFQYDAHSSSEDEPDPPHRNGSEGEITEQYKVLTVPTKADPPSSVTRQRMDRWGRPVSPFPLEACNGTILVGAAADYDRLPSPADIVEDLPGSDLSEGTPHPPATSSSPPPSRTPSPARDSSRASHASAVLVQEEIKSPSPSPSPSPAPTSSPVHYAAAVPSQEEVQLPLSHSQSVDEDGDGDYFTQGHDTIAEYDVPLAGGDDSSVASNTPRRASFNSLGFAFSGPLHQESSPLHEWQASTQKSDGQDDDFEDMYAEPSFVSIDEATREIAAKTPEATDLDERQDVASEDEEDAASVVRELSQEPDFRDAALHIDAHADNAPLQPPSPPTAGMQVMSSPHNPFQSHSLPVPGSSKDPRRFQNSEGYNHVHTPFFDGNGGLHEDWYDDSELAELDPGVVKITSEDPMAAARAAVILRLHKYDCIDAPPALKRLQSLRDSVMKTARRKSVMQSGVIKGTSSLPRRRNLGGVIDDERIRPDGMDLSLPELLREAEETFIMEEGGLILGLSPFSSSREQRGSTSKTPGHDRHRVSKEALRAELPLVAGPRDWTKADWKRLDGCYTDERLALAERLGLPAGSLASAEAADVHQVVNRFVSLMGGETAVENLGSAWTLDNLLRRARALRRKQSSGNVAPSNQSPAANTTYRGSPSQHYSFHMSPNMSSHEHLLPQTSLFPPRNAAERSVRYTSLREEASSVHNSISADRPRTLDTSVRSLPDSNAPPPPPPLTPSLLASKVKDMILAYLPVSKPSTQPLPKAGGSLKAIGLPVPPPEIFKKPRAPIATPAPMIAPKPPHPRDLVRLHHVPSTKASKIAQSRPASVASDYTSFTRERRDSNASVKDLVKTFEDLEKVQAAECESQKVLELRKKRSMQKLTATKSKAVWRP